jgi:hypothetical protein
VFGVEWGWHGGGRVRGGVDLRYSYYEEKKKEKMLPSNIKSLYLKTNKNRRRLNTEKDASLILNVLVIKQNARQKQTNGTM